MRHAFLIIAHNEFEILQRLISQLDSEECDIYVHIDKKVKVLPELSVFKSKLYILSDRVDVRWGNVSQIRTELLLLSYANSKSAESGKTYDYFHIISGTHLLLTDMDGFNSYFSSRPSAVFEKYYTDEYETDIKVRRYSLFTKTFASRNHFIARLSQVGWSMSNRIQRTLKIKRYRNETFVKASNWCSFSSEAVGYLIDNKKSILKKYRQTFCADEFFAPSELLKTPFSKDILWRDDYIYADFTRRKSPKVLTFEDYDSIVSSHCLWARKFSGKDMAIVDKITGK